MATIRSRGITPENAYISLFPGEIEPDGCVLGENGCEKAMEYKDDPDVILIGYKRVGTPASVNVIFLERFIQTPEDKVYLADDDADGMDIKGTAFANALLHGFRNDIVYREIYKMPPTRKLDKAVETAKKIAREHGIAVCLRDCDTKEICYEIAPFILPEGVEAPGMVSTTLNEYEFYFPDDSDE